MRSAALWAGAVLVVLPLLGMALFPVGLLPDGGGHGLGRWMFLGTCAVVLLCGLIVNLLLARGGARAPRVLAWLAALGLLLFLAWFGAPFAK